VAFFQLHEKLAIIDHLIGRIASGELIYARAAERGSQPNCRLINRINHLCINEMQRLAQSGLPSLVIEWAERNKSTTGGTSSRLVTKLH